MQGRVMSVCISAVEVVWMPNQKLRRCCLDVAMCQAILARHYGIWAYVPVRVLCACLACRLCCFIVKCLFFLFWSGVPLHADGLHVHADCTGCNREHCFSQVVHATA
jgi:hypothetical protein